MSLFNYSKCDECKMLKITTLKVLNEYFLPEITKKSTILPLLSEM